MCGRVVLAGLDWPGLREWLELDAVPEAPLPRRYNIPPTTDLPIIRRLDGRRLGDVARWGLIPEWHRGGLRDWRASTINARAEDVANRPAFRDAYRRRRCVVPVSGYYEWQVRPDGKHPHYIHPASNAPALLMAGLWTAVRLPDFQGLTCTVLTEAVRPPLDAVHDRMPLMLPPEAMDAWLDGAPVEALPGLPMAALAWHEVGRAVSAVRNEGEALIAPLSPEAVPHPPPPYGR